MRDSNLQRSGMSNTESSTPTTRPRTPPYIMYIYNVQIMPNEKFHAICINVFNRNKANVFDAKHLDFYSLCFYV